jgi:hypothetical protein
VFEAAGDGDTRRLVPMDALDDELPATSPGVADLVGGDRPTLDRMPE